MKKNKILLTTSILGAVLIAGTGVYGLNKYSSSLSGNLVEWQGDKIAREEKLATLGGFSGKFMEDMPTERLGAIGDWWEYNVKVQVNSNSGGSTYGLSNVDMEAALNYSLTTLPDGESRIINGVETNAYYSIGVVFNTTTSDNKDAAEIVDVLFDKNRRQGPEFIPASIDPQWHNKNYEDATPYLVPTFDDETIDNPGTYTDYYQVETPGAISTSTDEYSPNERYHPWFSKSRVGESSPNYGDVPTGGYINDVYTLSTETEMWNYYVSEDEWHESFNNDETTIYGAEEYKPQDHFIFQFPLILDWDNYGTISPVMSVVGEDGDQDVIYEYTEGIYDIEYPAGNYYNHYVDNKDAKDKFGLVPAGDESSSYDGDTIENGKNRINFIAMSLEDEISLKNLVFTVATTTSADTKLTLDSGMDQYDENHELTLSSPLPKFSAIPEGTTASGNYGVDIIFDQTVIDAKEVIVNSIEYTVYGPTSKEDDTEMAWDHFYIDDVTATREMRTSADDPTIIEVPDFYSQVESVGGFDGDQTNGGEVDVDGNVVGGPNDWTPDPYVGDMEIGTTNPIKTTIEYPDLFYDESDTPITEKYRFETKISLSPTSYGRSKGTLDEVTEPNVIIEETEEIIAEENKPPVFTTFEVVDPKDLYIEPLSPALKVKIEGDTKTEEEDHGYGLSATYLDTIQLGAEKLNGTGELTGEQIQLSEPIDLEIDQVNGDGKFSKEIDADFTGITLSANETYRIFIRSTYGSEGSKISKDFGLKNDEADLEFMTTGVAPRKVNLENNVVTYDGGEATLTFDYSQTLPDTIVDGYESIDDYTIVRFDKLEVVNMNGETEEIVSEIEIPSDFDPSIDLDDVTITIDADELKANTNFNLMVKATDTTGLTTYSNAGNEFITDSLGAFAPTVSNVTWTNVMPDSGGNYADVQFDLHQQVNDMIGESQYSASGITSINFKLLESLEEGAAEIGSYSVDTLPTEDDSTITIATSDMLLEELEYAYSIDVVYAEGTVNKTGKLVFELDGTDEMKAGDVTITSASSTPTTLSLSLDINDAEITSGYDSYYVKSMDILDDKEQSVSPQIQWLDADGTTVIDSPVDTDVLEPFAAKANIFVSNIQSGTDISEWKIKFETNSIDESDEPTDFETSPKFNLGTLMTNSEVYNGTDLTGSIDPSREVMDITPIEVIEAKVDKSLTTTNQSVVTVSFNDTQDILSIDGVTLTSSNGEIFSNANDNLIINDLTTPSKEAGIKTYQFIFSGLNPDTEYSDFTFGYVISEQVTDLEGTAIVSKSEQQIEILGSFRTIPEPKKPFPWWIIILILLILIGVGLFLVWFFLLNNKYKVVETTETKEGSSTFRVNADEEFNTLISGRKLLGTQDGVEKEIKYSISGDVITLTGITNSTNVTKLTFKADEASNEKLVAKYETDLAKWEEAKAKAAEAEKEFTTEKPVKPEVSKDIKLGGKVVAIIPEEKPEQEVEEPKEKTLSKADAEKKEYLETLTKPKLVKVASTVYDKSSLVDYTKPQLVDLIMDEKQIKLEEIKKITVTAKVTLVK